LMEIVCGLSMWVVDRLFANHKLPKKYDTMLEKLKTLMDPRHSFAAYRTKLKESKGDALPYLGIFLRDVTFIEDGNLDFSGDTRINVEKLTLLSDQMQQLEQYQAADCPRKFDLDEALLNSLRKLEFVPEEQLETLSIGLEPLLFTEEEDPQDDTFDNTTDDERESAQP